MSTLIYIHGFNSSPQSTKAQQLKAYTERQQDVELLIPALDPNPRRAIRQLRDLINGGSRPLTLVGSSLGGFYASFLVAQYQVKAVLINPAVHAHVLLAAEVGLQTNYHTGEQWQFTAEHVQELERLDMPKPAYPELMRVWLEQGDEVLNWQDAAAYYAQAQITVWPDGNHNFSRFNSQLHALLAFHNGRE